jgi:MFS family permease
MNSEITIVDINPLPKMQLFVILIVLISEMSSLIYITPFLPFMIESFGVEEKNIGYYSGSIISSYMVGQFFSNIIWGYISERIGIKPVIMFGLLSSSICTFIFGFSKNLTWVITTRLVQGLLSGNLGVTKTYLYLITDKSNEAKAFSVFPVGMCIGSIIAPAIGGLLETPSKIWPSIGENDLLFIYPYLLPSIIISILPLIGFIIAGLYVKESYKNRTEEFTDINITTSEHNAIIAKSLFTKNIVLTILLYLNIRFTMIGSDNLFPLLLATSKKNRGLGFSTNQIGLIYVISASILMGYSIIVIPYLKNKLGTYKLFLIAQFLFPISIFSISLLSNMNNINNISLLIISSIFFIIKASIGSISIILINIMINNSVEKKYLGRINGISQSFAALGSIIGPILSGIAYSWSLKNDNFFPLNIHFSFTLFAVISVLNIIATALLDNSINNRIN